MHLMGSAVVSTLKGQDDSQASDVERCNSWCFADGQPVSFFLECVILDFVDLPVHCCTFSEGS